MAIKSWLKVQTSLEILENIAELFATTTADPAKNNNLDIGVRPTDIIQVH